MDVETKFLLLFRPVALGDRIDGGRVCRLGGWDKQELLRRNDLGANAFLLIRHTGMRIGECADLHCDCLHAMGPDQWAIHIPLGKLARRLPRT